MWFNLLCRDLSEISDYCTETNFLITNDHNSLRKTGVLMWNLKWDVHREGEKDTKAKVDVCLAIKLIIKT